MKTIYLHELLDEHGYVEGGTIVFSQAEESVRNGEIIIINMNNVESVPTNFLNTSLGALIDVYGIEKTKNSLRFSNVLKTQVERIKKYFRDYQSLISAN